MNVSLPNVPEPLLDNNSMATKQIDGDDVKKELQENENASGVIVAEIGQEENQLTIQSNESQSARKVYTKVSHEMMCSYNLEKIVLFCLEEQQFYTASFSSEMGAYYTCLVEDCECRVLIRNDQCYIGNAMTHYHEKKTGMYYNLLALNEIKQMLSNVDNQLIPTKQIFDNVVKR